MEAGTTPAQGTGSATIADLCARAAEQFADQVAIKHKVDGEWRDVTFAQVGEIVAEIGLGLIALGLRARRARRHPLQHPPGVGLRRLRDLLRRRRRRPDLPHQLARRVRVGRRQLGVGLRRLRGRRAGRQDRRGARAAARAAQDHRGRPLRRRRRRDLARRRCAPRGNRADARLLADAHRRRRPRRSVHLHLHLGHHRAAQGLRPDPRQLPLGARHGRRAAGCSRAATTSSTSSCRWPTRSRCWSSSARSTAAPRSPTTAATPRRSSAS